MNVKVGRRFANAVRLFHSGNSKRGRKTYFGETVVDEHEKPKLVNQVFSRVHKSYDLMNDLMSLGVHRAWKRYFVTKMAPGRNTILLDVAGGTGKIF